MEQGELCGDSPPPPPLPLQPPPLLTEVGSQHIDDLEESVWVSHHADKLAECQVRRGVFLLVSGWNWC